MVCADHSRSSIFLLFYAPTAIPSAEFTFLPMGPICLYPLSRGSFGIPQGHLPVNNVRGLAGVLSPLTKLPLSWKVSNGAMCKRLKIWGSLRHYLD